MKKVRIVPIIAEFLTTISKGVHIKIKEIGIVVEINLRLAGTTDKLYFGVYKLMVQDIILYSSQ